MTFRVDFDANGHVYLTDISFTSPLNAGFAAEVGVVCAELARRGASSAPAGIEGRQGFGPTHAGAARNEAFEGLGEAWVFPGISWKFHACCHGLHASLEALRDLRDAGLDPDEVESVRITTHPRWLDVCNQPEPSTGLGAKFSYRLTAAMMLRGVDTASLGTYDDALTQRGDLVALRDRVTVETDAGLPDTASRVEVLRTGGGTVAASYDLAAPNDLGLSERRLRAKAAALMGAEEAGRLWAAVEGLGSAPGVGGLAACMAEREAVPA